MPSQTAQKENTKYKVQPSRNVEYEKFNFFKLSSKLYSVVVSMLVNWNFIFKLHLKKEDDVNLCLTSHAVALSAPLCTAIIARSPVPVPISSICTFFPDTLRFFTACIVA